MGLEGFMTKSDVHVSWMVGPNWPNSGEIDIIEGVNQQSQNDMTLHTNAGCSITNNGAFTGTLTTPNCDGNALGQPNNAGCQIAASASNTYGAGFNANGGGVYATEWTSDHISVYFFPRGSIPSDIGSGNPNPAGWGNALAQFQGGCNIDSHFQNQQIVSLLTRVLVLNRHTDTPPRSSTRHSAATGPATSGPQAPAPPKQPPAAPLSRTTPLPSQTPTGPSTPSKSTNPPAPRPPTTALSSGTVLLPPLSVAPSSPPPLPPRRSLRSKRLRLRPRGPCRPSWSPARNRRSRRLVRWAGVISPVAGRRRRRV